MADGDRERSGGTDIFGSFVPWIVYWILVGNVDFRLAVLIALAVAAVHLLREVQGGTKPKVLDIGTLAVFAILTIVAYATDDTFLERWIQPLSNGALLAIAVVSLLIGRPFVRQYAREAVPEEYWSSPRFLRTTLVITWAWIAAFAVMTVSALIPPIVDGDATLLDQDETLGIVFYWVIPFLTLAVAILFTKWYPDSVERRSASAAASVET